jgi:hypothetical protein
MGNGNVASIQIEFVHAVMTTWDLRLYMLPALRWFLARLIFTP